MTIEMKKQSSLMSVLIVVTESSQAEVDVVRFSSFLESKSIPHEILIINNYTKSNIEVRPINPVNNQYLRNLEVINLKQVSEIDAVTVLGLEQSIGDYVVVFDPSLDSFEVIDQMRLELDENTDAIYAVNVSRRHPSHIYRFAEKIYEHLYYRLTSIKIGEDATRFRVMKRVVVNHILRQANPIGTYRSLPNTTGFVTKSIRYESKVIDNNRKSLMKSIKYGLSLAIETSHFPLRIVNVSHLVVTGVFLLLSLINLFNSLFSGNLTRTDSLYLIFMLILFLFSLTFNLVSEYILSLIRTIERKPQLFSSKSLGIRNPNQSLNVLDPDDPGLSNE